MYVTGGGRVGRYVGGGVGWYEGTRGGGVR